MVGKRKDFNVVAVFSETDCIFRKLSYYYRTKKKMKIQRPNEREEEEEEEGKVEDSCFCCRCGIFD